MKVPVSWMRQFVAVADAPDAVASRLGSCGFNVEGVDGDVIDFEITANRPDALSIYGLAREAAAAFDLPLTPLALADVPRTTTATGIAVSVEDADCGRYALAVLDVSVRPSPPWLADRLTAAGVRPINAVVDVTNYVMLEMGQPMHAFDAARLEGSALRIRKATPGEQLTTLDGETRELDARMLVIADASRPLAVAGVMGGTTSEVSATTTRIALESAWFVPGQVRATSRRLGLKTEASARFERGADPAAPVVAIARAVALFEEIGCGRLVGGVSDHVTVPHVGRTVTFRRATLTRMLGVAVPDVEVPRILTRLGFAVTPLADGWQVDVPTFRVDVAREADLVEEVGRHWGLDRVPASFPALRDVPRPLAPGILRGRLLRRLLTGAGLQEAVTFTFIEDASATPFGPPDDRIVIQNPLSEKFAVLRPSIVPGLVESLVYNRNRQASDVRLFEVGTVFSRTRGERTMVGWVLSGSRGTHWSGNGGPLTFADTKGVAELLAVAHRVSVEVTRATDLPWLVKGQGAVLMAGGERLGWVGQLQGRGVGDDPVFAGELDVEVLARLGAAASTAITPLPRYPSVVRDLSILVDERLPASDVRGTIRLAAPATLVSIREFDRYQGKGVPEGQVSLSIRLIFQDPNRTLTDADVQQALDRVLAALTAAHQAVLRGR